MLRYICISDLHAGAMTSLLSDHPSKDGAPSSVAVAFAKALGAFLDTAGSKGSDRAQLIVLGDVLDLQFSKREEASRSAAKFLKLLKETGGLADEVLATAGNHDHALWTDARLSLHAKCFADAPDAPTYRDSTDAFQKTDGVESRLLSAVLKEAGFTSCDFRYPNIGIQGPAGTVVLHHGHFIESEYSLMSRVKDGFRGRHRKHLTVDEISSENAGWLDFAWSSFGDAAGIGRDTELLYQKMLTSTGFRSLSAGWSKVIGNTLSSALPMAGNLKLRATLQMISRMALDATIGKFRDSARYSEVEALSDGGVAGLQEYLDGPTASQLAHNPKDPDHPKPLPQNMTFVFGHTHKPFASRIATEAFPTAVNVYNSGGWTLNGPRLDNAEGAAMILVDDQANTLAVRLFNTPENGKIKTAWVQDLSEAAAQESTFAKDVRAWLKATEKEWENLSAEATTAYQRRQRILLALTKGDPSSELRLEAAE